MDPNRKVHIKQPPVYIARSRYSTDNNKTGSWRTMRPEYQEKTSPCSVSCPAGEDIALIQMLTSKGLLHEAWETILMENPFPGVCGRVCYHPCENVCNRQQFDEPVAIHTIERFLADTATRYKFKPLFKNMEPKKEKIAITGSGPSGLSAAYFFARMGYSCDVFEENIEPGGILRWGIPEYRLPKDILKREISLIEKTGVKIHCGERVSDTFLKKIKKKYDAVFLGIGQGSGMSPGISGGNMAENSLEFLYGMQLEKRGKLKGDIAVIGGGNTAIDVARCVIRLGGRPIIIYRRRKKDMPAFDEEVNMAKEEGVLFRELLSPAKIEKNNDKYTLTLYEMKVTGINDQGGAVVKPEKDRIQTMGVNLIVTATGSENSRLHHNLSSGQASDTISMADFVLNFDSSGFPVVYGGDCVAEIKSVANAVASGKHAAIAMDIFFKEGKNAIIKRLEQCSVAKNAPLSIEKYWGKKRTARGSCIVSYKDINIDYFSISKRIVQPKLLKEERIRSFSEIDLKISEKLLFEESKRCFNCGICNQCDNCYIFCPDVAVVRDNSEHGRHINYDYCKGCGICVAECPGSAMVLREE